MTLFSSNDSASKIPLRRRFFIIPTGRNDSERRFPFNLLFHLYAFSRPLSNNRFQFVQIEYPFTIVALNSFAVSIHHMEKA